MKGLREAGLNSIIRPDLAWKVHLSLTLGIDLGGAAREASFKMIEAIAARISWLQVLSINIPFEWNLI